MCESMADNPSATVEIKRQNDKETEEEKEEEETTGQKYNGLSITIGGYNNVENKFLGVHS